jgi:DNA-binding response OmpR family regulator
MKRELIGHAVLIVEDEPLIALDIAESFRRAGASILMASKVRDGLRLAGHPDLSAAVLDFALSDGEGTALCECLKERGIPFILHSGYAHVSDACHVGVVIPKPARPDELVVTVVRLLHAELAHDQGAAPHRGRDLRSG